MTERVLLLRQGALSHSFRARALGNWLFIAPYQLCDGEMANPDIILD